LIQGLVSIDTTPLAAAPVNIGQISVSTDAEGKFQAQVPLSQDASISSGLLAIKFDKIADEEREVLPGTGEQVAAVATAKGGLIVVEASRRINPEPICLAYNQTGAEVLWFRYTNRYGETLEVPQMGLNSLSSPSGQPYPVSEFRSSDETQPDGFYGYEWAIEFFTWFNSGTNQEMVSASWTLLGKEVMVEQPKSEVPLCPSSGELAGCTEFSEAMSSRLFEQALSTVSRLSKECDKAKKRGLWAPKGTFRNPYLKQAAKSLRAIRAQLNALPANRYLCDGAAPAGCQQRTYPKANILAEFDKILRVKLPKGLQHIMKRYPAERRKFVAEINKQPTTFYSCNR
jgi:hypothetical protein